MEAIREKLMNEKSITEGRMQAENLVNMAIAELKVLPESHAKHELEKLAQSVIERDH